MQFTIANEIGAEKYAEAIKTMTGITGERHFKNGLYYVTSPKYGADHEKAVLRLLAKGVSPNMMTLALVEENIITIVRAVYEKGTLHLDAPLPLAEGESIEVTLNLPTSLSTSRKRFSWEEGSILPGDSYSGDIADEVCRQRDGKQG